MIQNSLPQLNIQGLRNLNVSTTMNTRAIISYLKSRLHKVCSSHKAWFTNELHSVTFRDNKIFLLSACLCALYVMQLCNLLYSENRGSILIFGKKHKFHIIFGEFNLVPEAYFLSAEFGESLIVCRIYQNSLPHNRHYLVCESPLEPTLLHNEDDGSRSSP